MTNVRYNADQVSTGNPLNWDRWVDYGYQPGMLNRWYLNDNGNFSWVSAGNLNQYTNIGASTLDYDAQFNLLRYNGYQFNHDAQNLLTSATGNGAAVTLTYDGLGRCVRRVVNGATTSTTLIAYDGWKPTVEWDGAGNFKAWNLYGAGADEILWRYQVGFDHLRYHHDIHGNVTSVLAYAGNILEKYTYDAFGKPTILSADNTQRSTSAVGNRFLFQGREYLQELGIYDYRHRMYHPGLGRFLQTDPIGSAAGDTNLFRYCGDDPVDKSDPMGLYETPAGGWENFSGGKPASYEMDAYRDSLSQPAAASVSIRVASEIRRPDSQSGMKTEQTVTLNQNGKWTETAQAGSTKFAGGKVSGFFLHSADVSPVQGKSSMFNVSMTGYAVSKPLVAVIALLNPALAAATAIHYNFHATVNFSHHTASLAGWHSSYPSFTGSISGHPVFDRFQSRPPLLGLLPFFEVRESGLSDF